MGADHLQLREAFESAGEDESCESKSSVERSTKHLRKAEDFHFLIADGELWRMHKKRNFKLARQFKKRCCARGVKLLAIDTRVDHDSFEFIVADRLFGFLQDFAVLEWDGTGQTEQSFGVFRR